MAAGEALPFYCVLAQETLNVMLLARHGPRVKLQRPADQRSGAASRVVAVITAGEREHQGLGRCRALPRVPEVPWRRHATTRVARASWRRCPRRSRHAHDARATRVRDQGRLENCTTVRTPFSSDKQQSEGMVSFHVLKNNKQYDVYKLKQERVVGEGAEGTQLQGSMGLFGTCLDQRFHGRKEPEGVKSGRPPSFSTAPLLAPTGERKRRVRTYW